MRIRNPAKYFHYFVGELMQNLTYVKHYQGDVEDLGLTFSFDQVEHQFYCWAS
jgi:hypothetical protein